MTNQPPYRLTATGSDGWLQIIGVVGDALNDGLDKPILPALYLPYTVNMFMGTQILVQTQGEPLSMLHDIRKEIAAVNPDQQIDSDVQDLEGWIRREPEFAVSRLISILFGAFSVWRWCWPAWGCTAWCPIAWCSEPASLASAWLWARSARTCFGSCCGLRVSAWELALRLGVALSLGLGRVITRWVENGVHDPLIGVGSLAAGDRGRRRWLAWCRRCGRWRSIP